MKTWTLALGLLMGCSGGGTGVVVTPDDDVVGNTDQDCPLITHTPVEDAQPYGEDVFITAGATDAESGVFIVSVYYKEETSNDWNDQQLRAVDAAGTFEGYIPGEDVQSAGMNYYIEAIDGADNSCTLPEDAPDDSYHFRVYQTE